MRERERERENGVELIILTTEEGSCTNARQPLNEAGLPLKKKG